MAGQQPKPGQDNTAQIETRLLVVAEMLERAVAEVRRAMDEIKSGAAPPPAKTAPDIPQEVRKPDVQ